MTLLQNKLKIKLINIQKRIKPSNGYIGGFFNANSLAVRFFWGHLFWFKLGLAMDIWSLMTI